MKSLDMIDSFRLHPSRHHWCGITNFLFYFSPALGSYLTLQSVSLTDEETIWINKPFYILRYCGPKNMEILDETLAKTTFLGILRVLIDCVLQVNFIASRGDGVVVRDPLTALESKRSFIRVRRLEKLV